MKDSHNGRTEVQNEEQDQTDSNSQEAEVKWDSPSEAEEGDIKRHIVIEDYYYDEEGEYLSPGVMVDRLSYGSYVVFNLKQERIGRVIAIRRVNGCLEALIDTKEK